VCLFVIFSFVISFLNMKQTLTLPRWPDKIGNMCELQLQSLYFGLLFYLLLFPSQEFHSTRNNKDDLFQYYNVF